MKRKRWNKLSRKRQLRLLHAMRTATSMAFELTNDQIERMLNGLWDAEATMVRRKK